MKTVEQMVRDLLEYAIKDGLVAQIDDPQELSSGDLVGVANELSTFLREAHSSGERHTRSHPSE